MTGLVAGKAGFVTGAASGIGRGIALELAREGASVVVSDLESQRTHAEETVELARKQGAQALFVPCDVTDRNQVDELVAAVRTEFGKIDFAVNNAGIGPKAPLAEASDASLDLTISINLKGVFYGIRAAICAFLDQDTPGAIINTSSVAGAAAVRNIGIYGATKHAIIGLTKNAAKEYGNRGIRANALLPNAIRTPLVEDAPAAFIEQITAPQAIKRLGEPTEVGFAAAFLISDRAAFITGIELPVDGGYLTGP
jgi:NAD(P)-dependent dehydrogenase (short-subunit alcohol dehydrogenase family)